MAEVVMMKHPTTGVVKKGFYGFSWTTFCFAGIPALMRGDILVGVLVTAGGVLTANLVSLIWAFVYNKKYTLSLIEKGYVFADSEAKVTLAQQNLGIAPVDKV